MYVLNAFIAKFMCLLSISVRLEMHCMRVVIHIPNKIKLKLKWKNGRRSKRRNVVDDISEIITKTFDIVYILKDDDTTNGRQCTSAGNMISISYRYQQYCIVVIICN